MTPSLVSCRSTKMPGYLKNDLDEAQSHSSPYTFPQSVVSNSSGTVSFALSTEQPAELVNSTWPGAAEGSHNLDDYPDDESTHSGATEDYLLTSVQSTSRGSRMICSQKMGPTWTSSRISRRRAIPRASSNKSNASSQMSHQDLRSNTSILRTVPQTTASMVGIDPCLLVDSDPCTSSLFWDNGFTLGLGSLDTTTPFQMPSVSEMHVAPSEMQYGPDASLGSCSPSSLDCFSSPSSSPETFDDQTWVTGPLSPPRSSPDLKDESPVNAENALLFTQLDSASSEELQSLPAVYGARRSIGEGESARDHVLYKNAIPQADGLYHCPWEGQSSCTHRPEKLKCNYDKFVDSHLKPYRCKVDSCEGNRFSSTACLLRHEREAHGLHGHGDKPFLCMYKGCERSLPGSGFPRQWNLRDHMKRVHNDYGTSDGSHLSSLPSRQQPPKGRKRKSEGSVSQANNSTRKATMKSVSTANTEQASVKPLLDQWMDHLHAVEEMINGLDQPEDARNVQQISEMQNHLTAMAKMTTDMSTNKSDFYPTPSYNVTG